MGSGSPKSSGWRRAVRIGLGAIAIIVAIVAIVAIAFPGITVVTLVNRRSRGRPVTTISREVIQAERPTQSII